MALCGRCSYDNSQLATYFDTSLNVTVCATHFSGMGFALRAGAECRCVSFPGSNEHCPIPEHQHAAMRMWDRRRQRWSHKDRERIVTGEGARPHTEVYEVARDDDWVFVQSRRNPIDIWREKTEHLDNSRYLLPEAPRGRSAILGPKAALHRIGVKTNGN